MYIVVLLNENIVKVLGSLEVRILYSREIHKMLKFQVPPHAMHYRFGNMFLQVAVCVFVICML